MDASCEPDLDARDLARELDRVVRSLEPRARTVFILRFVERLTLPEVAESMGTSESTVKRVAEQARAHVTRALADDPVLSAYLRFRAERETE